MGINTGSNIHKALRVGSTVISRAFLGSAKIYDQLDYPTLDLNFALTKTLDSRITFTRASSGTYFDSSGVIQTATTNTPRFDHNPVTGVSLGLLIEEQRTNLLLNSAILSTQSVTVTNVAHTLSFYGTGTIVLSGVHSATLNGTGGFPTRTTLTFTPTAGTLTLTVSGTVQYAQLSIGNFATSWIPTTGASATRAADNALITGTNFSSWYNQDEGAFLVSGNSFAPSNAGPMLVVQVSGGNSRHQILSTSLCVATVNGGILQANMGTGVAFGNNIKVAFAYKNNNFGFSSNGGNADLDLSGFVPNNLTYAVIGRFDFGGGQFFNGTIGRISHFNRRLPNSELIILSS